MYLFPNAKCWTFWISILFNIREPVQYYFAEFVPPWTATSCSMLLVKLLLSQKFGQQREGGRGGVKDVTLNPPYLPNFQNRCFHLSHLYWDFSRVVFLDSPHSHRGGGVYPFNPQLIFFKNLFAKGEGGPLLWTKLARSYDTARQIFCLHGWNFMGSKTVPSARSLGKQ